MLKRGKLDELVAGVREQGIDAAGLQELRLRVDCKDDYATMSLDGGYRLVYSSCSEAGVGGVGILIAPKLSDQMTEVKCVSERIIMASFKLKSEHSRLHLISAHAPIEAADDEEKDAYYDDLSTLVMGIPVHDVTVILVDANAQVGRDISSPALGRFCYHGKTNDNGKIRFRGFYGKYEVTLKTQEGRFHTFEIHLAEDEANEWQFSVKQSI